MNAKRFGFRLIAGLLLLLASSQTSHAEDSNRKDVQGNLENDEWSVVWGKTFTEVDWVKGAAAIAESVASENPGPFLKWFGEVLEENFLKLEKNLVGVARRDLEQWVVDSLKQKRLVEYKGLRIEAGFATYNRWQRVVYDEPRTRETWIQIGPLKTKGFETYTARVEKKVSLPNWHQFYIRYKLIPVAKNEDRVQGQGGGQPKATARAAVLPDGSRFMKDGSGDQWTEYHSDGRKKCFFRELRSDGRMVFLRDDGRKLTLGLPLAGGKILWQYDGEESQDWNAISWTAR